MLKIRKTQMDALSSEMVITFEERAADYLRQAFPDWSRGMDEAELAGFVGHGRKRAERHGLRSEQDAVRYLVAMQGLGMRFDEAPEHPWAPALLSLRISPAEKLNRLEDAALYQREARRIRHAR